MSPDCACGHAGEARTEGWLYAHLLPRRLKNMFVSYYKQQRAQHEPRCASVELGLATLRGTVGGPRIVHSSHFQVHAETVASPVASMPAHDFGPRDANLPAQ